MTSSNTTERPSPPEQAMRALLHRWFVEYNPLYLLSAALVVTGCFFVWRGLAREDCTVASIGVASVSELYALSLVGGVALLVRIGRTRPAVFLTLLFVLYQWDVTLHTEMSAYLGSVGSWSVAGWFALFVAKVYLLARALRVRIARGVLGAAIFAALGLAVGPRVLREVGPTNGGALIAVWLFALGALHRPTGVTSLVELTPWGRIVLRRVTAAAWCLSGAMIVFHVLFWASERRLSLGPILTIVPLLFVRRVRREASAWWIVGATAMVVALGVPEAFGLTALLSAVALCLRAVAPTFEGGPPAGDRAASVEDAPYRGGGAAPFEDPAALEPSAPFVGPEERARLFVGAAFALYFSAWAIRADTGAWPAYVAAIELTLVVFLTTRRLRLRLPVVPLVACYGHIVASNDLLPVPRSSLAWGITTIALGFVLLGASLAAAYFFRVRPVMQPIAEPPGVPPS